MNATGAYINSKAFYACGMVASYVFLLWRTFKHTQAPIRMFWKSHGFLGYFSIFLELNLFFEPITYILESSKYFMYIPCIPIYMIFSRIF